MNWIAEREELDLWTKSIKFMIKHFVQKYGIDYVRQWNFESWNEPDHHIHNPFGRQNNATYLNYLEATWNALLEVSIQILDFDCVWCIAI